MRRICNEMDTALTRTRPLKIAKKWWFSIMQKPSLRPCSCGLPGVQKIGTETPLLRGSHDRFKRVEFAPKWSENWRGPLFRILQKRWYPKMQKLSLRPSSWGSVGRAKIRMGPETLLLRYMRAYFQWVEFVLKWTEHWGRHMVWKSPKNGDIP